MKQKRKQLVLEGEYITIKFETTFYVILIDILCEL